MKYNQRNTENTEVLAIRLNNNQNFGPVEWLELVAGSLLVEMTSFDKISAMT